MGIFGAKIQIGWITDCFEGNSACEIISDVERVQDFDCLLRMGRMEEGKKGQKELTKLESFLEKYRDGTLTMEDVNNLDIKLSIGTIKCLDIAETEEGIAKLRG